MKPLKTVKVLSYTARLQFLVPLCLLLLIWWKRRNWAQWRQPPWWSESGMPLTRTIRLCFSSWSLKTNWNHPSRFPESDKIRFRIFMILVTQEIFRGVRSRINVFLLLLKLLSWRMRIYSNRIKFGWKSRSQFLNFLLLYFLEVHLKVISDSN